MLTSRWWGTTGDRRRSDSDPKVTKFAICSPLLAGKNKKDRDKCMMNPAPFWALLRCARSVDTHNMELDTVVLRDPGYVGKASAYPKPPRGAIDFALHLTIARNVEHAAKGDLLCLPFVDGFVDR